jgi:hypothetical protein
MLCLERRQLLSLSKTILTDYRPQRMAILQPSRSLSILRIESIRDVFIIAQHAIPTQKSVEGGDFRDTVKEKRRTQNTILESLTVAPAITLGGCHFSLNVHTPSSQLLSDEDCCSQY